MEMKIKDFGPIDYLKFNLDKDLHLIYGQNAIGKSYATYCIYCLLKNIKNKAIGSQFYYFRQSNQSKYDKLMAPRLKNLKTNSRIDFSKHFIPFVESELKEV